jgi:hypothetical protein
MKKTFIFLVLVPFLLIACERNPISTQEKSEARSVPKAIAEKERVEKEEPLPLEVKIKLRRDGKDNYSWEISGSDVNQILKVNEKLRKQLGGEQTR